MTENAGIVFLNFFSELFPNPVLSEEKKKKKDKIWEVNSPETIS